MTTLEISSSPLDDLLAAAIKAEEESARIYRGVAGQVRTAFLRDRMFFLGDEEDKHRAFLEEVFQKTFPGRTIKLPASTPVPLVEINFPPGEVPLSSVLAAAMRAEDAAASFYRGLAGRWENDPRTRDMMLYLAAMEVGHYKLLESERENVLRFEDYDVTWPAVHVGP